MGKLIETIEELLEVCDYKSIDGVNWYYISEYQKLSESFIEKHKLSIRSIEDNWLYATVADKIDYITKYTDYEVIDNSYIIGYKSCRSDGYSCYNFQYRYEVGQTYVSHADYNLDNENSFGLSACSKHGALKYCAEKLFKVRLDVCDISAIVHNNHKIRTSKLTILEEIEI